MESRMKELRKENEMLNEQKQDLKSSMRMERLEMSKKYEKEKEELAEKYRNELKTLRKNLEKTVSRYRQKFSCGFQILYSFVPFWYSKLFILGNKTIDLGNIVSWFVHL